MRCGTISALVFGVVLCGFSYAIWADNPETSLYQKCVPNGNGTCTDFSADPSLGSCNMADSDVPGQAYCQGSDPAPACSVCSGQYAGGGKLCVTFIAYGISAPPDDQCNEFVEVCSGGSNTANCEWDDAAQFCDCPGQEYTGPACTFYTCN